MSYYRFLGCEIIYREACYLTAVGPNKVDIEFLPKGLHDLETADMVARLQGAIDAIEDSDKRYEAVLLGYARCNDGLAGVEARSTPLVLPRAHDCITFFFGSRKAYMDYFENQPGTYYGTTGWLERGDQGDGITAPAFAQTGVMANLGLADSYEVMVEKYGKDNADYIMEAIGDWTRHYSKMLYLEMGLGDEESFIERYRRRAEKREWEFELIDGDWGLLKKLFYGRWDDDFLVVPPGGRIAAANDDSIVRLAD